jgi:hypothetical protein
MIKVIVEIWPGGRFGLRKTIGSMDIANVSDLADRSDYEAFVHERANPLAWTPGRTCIVRVTDHDRRQSVWRLVAAVVSAMDNAEYEEE